MQPTETTEPKQTHLWTKGQSGNPAGRPVGARHKSTLAVQALLEGEAEALTRSAIQAALGGDMTALRLCLERILPPRKDATITIDLPSIEGPGDIITAHAIIVEATAAGELTPSQGSAMADIVASSAKAIELHDLSQRIDRLEQQMAKATESET